MLGEERWVIRIDDRDAHGSRTVERSPEARASLLSWSLAEARITRQRLRTGSSHLLGLASALAREASRKLAAVDGSASLEGDRWVEWSSVWLGLLTALGQHWTSERTSAFSLSPPRSEAIG